MTDTDHQKNNEQEEDVNVLISKAELDPSIPKIYFNEIAGACTAIDVTFLFSRKGVVQGVAYMSLPVARHLVDSIGGILDQQEADLLERFKNEQNNEENP